MTLKPLSCACFQRDHLRPVLIYLVIAPWMFYCFRSLAIPGGDTGEMLNRIVHPWQFFMRAPLVILLNKSFFVTLRDFGWTPVDCYALSSSIAGGVFLYALSRMTRNPWVWALCLGNKGVLIFFGHLENYAWPFAASMLCFAMAAKADEPRFKSGWVWLMAVIAVFFHPMALMIWPGLLWSFRPLSRAKAVQSIAFLAAALAVFDFFLAIGNVDGFFRTDWVLRAKGGALCPYGVFSAEHWQLLTGFHLRSMPVGLPLLLIYWRHLRPGWQQGIGLTAALTLLWSMVWCPSMGEADWDLFVWPSLFVNLAGGLGWLNRRSLRL